MPPLAFLHVSKTGGTTFLDLMKRNVDSERLPPGHGAWRQGDGPQWCQAKFNDRNIGFPKERSCALRAASCTANKYQAFAVERWLDNGGEICDAFLYATVVRDPLTRVISHLNHFFRGVKNKSDKGLWGANLRENFCTNCSLDLVKAAAPDFFQLIFDRERCNATSIGQLFDDTALGARGSFGDTICSLSSNYQARHLLGSSLAENPFDFIATGDAQEQRFALQAAETLLSMSVVFHTLRTDSDAETLLRSTLGWGDIPPSHSNLAENPDERVVLSIDTLTATERQKLLDLNRLDAQLHRLAVATTALDVATFRRWARL